MTGISDITVQEFQDRINSFNSKYVNDWDSWISGNCDAAQFGSILRKWQACRPNRMRREQTQDLHDKPYLEDLINSSHPYLPQLQSFDIRCEASITSQACESLGQLWNVFTELSYHGRARGGQAGIVGISKATLLLTQGRVGPAFDSTVRKNLGLSDIENAKQWIEALRFVSQDIEKFEKKNGTTLQNAAPLLHNKLPSGRIYDMALGPAMKIGR